VTWQCYPLAAGWWWLSRQITREHGYCKLKCSDPYDKPPKLTATCSHCHIAWHAGEGLAAQFLESVDQIETVDPSGSAFQQTCANWNAYYPSKADYLRDYAESGI